jgi:hypothetical protein
LSLLVLGAVDEADRRFAPVTPPTLAQAMRTAFNRDDAPARQGHECALHGLDMLGT